MVIPSEVLFWETAATDLDLEIVAPFELPLPDGHQLIASAVVRNFGAPLGMVVVGDFDVIRPHTAFLKSAGYGYSAGVGGNEYNRDQMIDVLNDWGWTGPEDEIPEWLD